MEAVVEDCVLASVVNLLGPAGLWYVKGCGSCSCHEDLHGVSLVIESVEALPVYGFPRPEYETPVIPP